MKDLNIDYVLLKKDKDQNLEFPIDKTFLSTSFENSEYIILRYTVD